MTKRTSKGPFFPCDKGRTLASLGEERLLEILDKMLGIRYFELRAEAAYLQGKVGGFFHSYIGQEAVQTSVVEIFGKNHWYATSYRCHALALLLGVSPQEIMAEFFGRKEGNAKGRGGSMHLYADQLLGGFGIVCGQLPVAIGAGLSAKYLGEEKYSICFLGDGAVAQGAFSESLNLASVWDLPCLVIIENNLWGMGTAVSRAICVEHIADKKGPAFNMSSYTFDGMDFAHCYEGFTSVKKELEECGKPILVEVVTERFKGHSISDPGLYRKKEDVHAAMQQCAIKTFKDDLIEMGFLSEEEFKKREKQAKDAAMEATNYAESCTWPSLASLGEGVYAE